MATYPHFDYSNGDVKRAGEVIASNLIWTEETAPKIREAFSIANNWRDSHAYPMRSIRYSALYHMKQHGLTGVTAARLKRMQAIRRKLRRIRRSLNQLQDLGGCRIILPTIADVHTLVGAIKDHIKHNIRDEDNYIIGPKKDGYRSHHLMLNFRGRGATEIYNGRRVELQVRTRLQHSWATAVEAVGLFRNEELKNHQGSEEWLRLFMLMSAEFAEAERCPIPPNCPEGYTRQQEIKDLAKSLDAVSVLESVSYGIHGTDFPLTPGYRPTHYLIRYDHATKTVHVEPHRKVIAATHSYDIAEEEDNETGKDTQNVVLVEVDKIENLKAAYPNYFGDVDLFKSQLRSITLGKSAAEYLAAKRPARPQPPAEREDPSWLRRNRFPKPGIIRKKEK
jgi:ppGpp synthetase/RelA/SpoT-type nucleotidyltranferase